MQRRSQYDELHDKYNSIETTKAGTRYERLAAMVFRYIEESGVVLHDRRLIGDTGVKHQIDITIKTNSNKRRVLIECKDFDLSDNKVGLPIIRNFWAVVDDIKPAPSGKYRPVISKVAEELMKK